MPKPAPPDAKGARKPSASATARPDRAVGLAVGVVVGLATATAGLLAGIPAPTLVARAAIVGVIFRVLGGWCGLALVRSLAASAHAHAHPSPPSSSSETSK